MLKEEETKLENQQTNEARTEAGDITKNTILLKEDNQPVASTFTRESSIESMPTTDDGYIPEVTTYDKYISEAQPKIESLSPKIDNDTHGITVSHS